MQSIIILAILSLGSHVVRAQLNYEGNPLTENTDYTAEESKFSRSNAKQDYQRFEITDGRMFSLSKEKFAPLSASKTIEGSSLGNNDSPIIRSDPSFITPENVSSSIPSKHKNANTLYRPIEQGFPEVSLAQSEIKSQSETRQFREYPIDSQTRNHQSAWSPEAHYSPRTQVPTERASLATNLVSQSQNSLPIIHQASGQALSQFLNSRTPQESEIALQNYLTMREQTAKANDQQFSSISGESTRKSIDQRTILRDNANNGLLKNYDNHNSLQQIDNVQAPLPSDVSSGVSMNDPTGEIGYSSGQRYQQPQHHQQYPPLRWNQIAPQSRRDGFYPGSIMRRPTLYRGPMRIRGNPWAQSRISPGPSFYHQKGPIFPGPPAGPPGPPAGLNGHWNQPVEVIYTKPPGFGGHDQPLSNPPVPYEDASKWFPNSDEPPKSQKDIYYSQLYAQSYDPHYYNYIAKTGKIKPWLYGKLGKDEDKGIWWELFRGFQKHGMKNMMNPMFLLGMSIPTLTLMLSALVQKRSYGGNGRSIDLSIGNLTADEWMMKYEKEIAGALMAYEQQIKDRTESNKNIKLTNKPRNRRR